MDPATSLAAATFRARRLAIAAALSIGIEVSQYAVSGLVGVAYRSTDVDDVILNVVGAGLGVTIFRVATLVQSARRWLRT